MKRQYLCCKCRLACNITWKSDSTSEPVTCKVCQSAERKSLGDRPQHHGLARAQSLGSASPLLPSVLPEKITMTLHRRVREPNQASSGLDNQGSTQVQAQSRESSSLSLPKDDQGTKHRFANEHHQAGMCQKTEGDSRNQGHSLVGHEPMYDDVLIYVKSKLIYDDEIGLGAVSLLPHVPLIKCSEPKLVQVKTEPDADDDYASSCWFDVPIRGIPIWY